MSKTSWNNVAGWYNDHIKNDKENYHKTLIAPKLSKAIKRYLPNKSSSIIDIACGQGYITNVIAEIGYKVKGIDDSQKLVDFANRQYSSIDFSKEDATKISSKFIEENQNTSAVMTILAIQNIQNLTSYIQNCDKILRKDGFVFLLLNHPYFRIPKHSSWGYENDNSAMYRKVYKYKSEMKIPILMEPGKVAEGKNSEITYSFHRPLEFYIREFSANKFALVDMEEWNSNKVSQPGPRANAENISRSEIPLFMLLIFKKIK